MGSSSRLLLNQSIQFKVANSTSSTPFQGQLGCLLLTTARWATRC